MPELAIEESDELEVSPGDTPDSITIRPRFAPTAPTKLVTAENDSQGCPVHSTGGRDICICGEERDDRGALKEDPDNPSPAPPTFEDGLSFCRHGLHRHRLPDGSYCLWAERAPRPVCVCYRNDQLINVVAGEIPGNGAAVVMSNENVRIETGCYPILVRLTSRIRWELAATAALDHPGEINLLNTLTGDIGDLLLADGTPLFSDPTDPVFPGGFGDCSFQIPMAHQHDGEVADPGAQGGAFQVFRVWDHLQKVDDLFPNEYLLEHEYWGFLDYNKNPNNPMFARYPVV